MKRILLLCITSLVIAFANAQSDDKVSAKEKIDAITDTLTVEQKESIYHLIEEVLIQKVDSAIDEGRFMNALEIIDSLRSNWKYITGREVSPMIYLKKNIILMNLEEWEELNENASECFSIHKNNLTDNIAAILRSSQGMACRNLSQYKEAIGAYEKAMAYYTKLADLGSQGGQLCDMANCYVKLNKQLMASDLYNKGMEKYLEYFGITRSQLLKERFTVTDSFKKTVLRTFAVHLYGMAVLEEEKGNRTASKDYLLMSAHCGYETALSEYQRIYGK